MKRLILHCSAIGLSIALCGAPSRAGETETHAPAAGDVSFGAPPCARENLAVFLDITSIDPDHVKREIPFVRYVRDRTQAHVHIILTERGTGSQAIEHTVTLIGRGRFEGDDDTLSVVTRDTDTEERVRSEVVRIMKLGLMRYVSKTPAAGDIRIVYHEERPPEPATDRWDYWVFHVNTSGSFSGQKSVKDYFLNLYLTADRVTPAWKTNFGLSLAYSESNFNAGDLQVTSISRENRFEGTIVRSLGKHWSAGGYGSFLNVTYYNLEIAAEVAPALEYSFFPYSESTRRDLRLFYRLGYLYRDYEKETIYYKTDESLFSETFILRIDVKEQWGSAQASLTGSHYLHDASKNRLVFSSYLNLRLYEGLSLTIFGSYSRVRDQLSLPRLGATDEEILLQRKELATQYYYSISVGLTYRFGSRFSDVVNPRFM